ETFSCLVLNEEKSLVLHVFRLLLLTMEIKLPIIMHRVSGQVSSEETKRQAIPVITARRMNERMYIIIDIFLFELTISSKTNKKFNQFESCEHLL
ncbi:hypothetical protein POUND7_013679, partial [Theobroma cacao]